MIIHIDNFVVAPATKVNYMYPLNDSTCISLIKVLVVLFLLKTQHKLNNNCSQALPIHFILEEGI